MPTINDIQDIKPSINYIGVNLQTSYVYPFPIFDEKDIVVLIDDVEFILNVDYTVTGVTNDNGGTVVLTVATTGGEEILLYRDTDVDRLTDYVENGDFLAETVNNDFDRIILMIQELKNGVLGSQRAIRVGPNDTVSDEGLILADVATRANKVLAFDENGEVTTVEITDGDTLLTFVRDELTVIPGETIYPLQKPLDAQNVVVVDGEILPKKSYGTNIDGDLVLNKALYNPELMFEVWNRLISTIEPNTISSKNFAFPTSVILEQLNETNVVFTNDGVATADNFGATFASTNLVDVLKAGTINVPDASLYDTSGRQFKIVGAKIRLEQLGIPYTETGSVVLDYIVQLRVNGFEVEVSTEYELTQVDNRRNIQNNVKQWIIHRGLQDIAPENTMLAFSMAYNRMKGQNIAFECDVQITSDGIPVVYHDITLDTLTNGTGFIRDVTFAYLQTLTFDSMVGKFGEDLVHIPSFDEFMKYASRVGVEVYPESKEYRTIDDISLMIDIIQKYQMSAMTVINSFRIADLEKMRELDQQIQIGYVTETTIPGATIESLDSIGNITIMGSINYIAANPVDLAIIQSKGWSIAAWTIVRAETAAFMSTLGIQKLIVDRNLAPVGDMTVVSAPCVLNSNPWSLEATASGSVIFSANPENSQSIGEVATCIGEVGSIAQIRLPFNMSAGESIKLTIFAANIDGHVDGASIDVNRPEANRKNTENVVSTELMEYEVSYDAPWNTSFSDYSGGFVLGSKETRDSGAIFFAPTVSSSHSHMGTTRTIMMGCIVIASGGVAGVNLLDSQTASINADGDGIAPASDPLGIKIRPQRETNLINTLGNQFANAIVNPLPTGQDTEAWTFECNARNPQGAIDVFARNPSGVKVNLNTTTIEHRFYFEVKI